MGCIKEREPVLIVLIEEAHWCFPGADKAQEGRREGFCRKMASEEKRPAESREAGGAGEMDAEMCIRNYRLPSQ